MEVIFDNPEYLILLLSIPLLIITHYYFLKYTNRKAIKFANFEALKRVTGKKIITKNLGVLFLRILIILFLVLGISGPVIWYRGESDSNDFIIAIDTSASMTTNDMEGTRFDSAKSVAKEFIGSLEGNANVGLVSFSGASFVETMATSDREQASAAIDSLKISIAGGTDIGGAIITSTNILLASRSSKKILLITDGSNTVGPFIDDDVQAGIDYANRYKVIINTVGIGTESGRTLYAGDNVNIPVGYSKDVLRSVASQTGGEFYDLKTESDLDDFFKRIKDTEKEAFIPIELRFGLVTVSLLLIFIEWGLINTRFRPIP